MRTRADKGMKEERMRRRIREMKGGESEGDKRQQGKRTLTFDVL